MDDHVVFFFGSGVSMPTFRAVSDSDFEGSVEEITEKVSDACLVFTENKRYAFPDSVETNSNIGQPHETSDERVARVRSFLEAVREHAEAFLDRFNRDVTYEDLYALCGEVQTNQGERTLAHQPVNPEVSHFAEALREVVGEDLLDSSEDPRNPLAFTANEATFLISGVVREMLSDSPDEIQGLDPLLVAIEELDRVTIVTLNHDLLLEQFLIEHDIDFDDGFDGGENGYRKYSPERLFDVTADVTLIKPHGSINWYYDRGEDAYFSFSSIPPNPDQESFDLHPEPSILSGYRKEENYTGGIFGDMVDALLQALHDTNTVIESGFGWTDIGMYNHLRRYLDWDGENKLLLLHQEDDDIFSEAHPFSYFDSSFPGTRPPDGLIRELSKYLSCTCWAEVKDHIE